ncbi:PxKF domain-containing protein, partial [Azohydromonas lata]|uniref:PxKF domain-containing protein n=1 Tax=Azohydromonas lata TaxID=45677 RepID=UPI000A93B9B0
AIFAGFGHTVALKRDGTVLAWGYNDLGQINVPAGLSGVRTISAGWDHTVALKRDGTVAVWGWAGALPSTSWQGLMAIEAGRGHTLALKSSYRFGGFLDPVNALPVVNTVPAGTGVPVSFRLGADQGLDFFSSGFPVSRWVPCRAGANADEIEHTVPANSSSLRYDAGTGIYTYVWKTDPSWSGQCRRLILRLADGIEHTALFRFR